MKNRRHLWLVFGAGVAVVTAGLIWISSVVIRGEVAEANARTQAAHKESMRLALWRMDSWLGPFLAREASRQFSEYRPFYHQNKVYTKLLDQIAPGEVVTPSPLLGFSTEYIHLHFQWSETAGLTSPQVLSGLSLKLAEQQGVSTFLIEARRGTLDRFRKSTTCGELMEAVESASSLITSRLDEPLSSGRSLEVAGGGDQDLKSAIEFSKRAEAGASCQLPDEAAGATHDNEPVTVGPLVAFWLNSLALPDQLIFARKVTTSSDVMLQGFLGNWDSLQERLLNQVADLFPEAVLEPVTTETAARGSSIPLLATMPIMLVAPAPVAPELPWLTDTRMKLSVVWVAAMLATIAVGVALRSSIVFGRKRQRFASAVTHELRTPLTTFRMYTEMLADGVVSEPAERQSYLETLKNESERLSGLVENVLAYSRLEEGNDEYHKAPVQVSRLLDAVTPPLKRQTERAGMKLEVTTNGIGERTVQIDQEMVSRILFNLVDNACKYAHGTGDPTIHLDATMNNGSFLMTVRDHGPGIPAPHQKSIFEPFDRGAREPGDTMPGVGLGLSLCRNLARTHGGDLTLESASGGGAQFTVTLQA